MSKTKVAPQQFFMNILNAVGAGVVIALIGTVIVFFFYQYRKKTLGWLLQNLFFNDNSYLANNFSGKNYVYKLKSYKDVLKAYLFYLEWEMLLWRSILSLLS